MEACALERVRLNYGVTRFRFCVESIRETEDERNTKEHEKREGVRSWIMGSNDSEAQCMGFIPDLCVRKAVCLDRLSSTSVRGCCQLVRTLSELQKLAAPSGFQRTDSGESEGRMKGASRFCTMETPQGPTQSACTSFI